MNIKRINIVIGAAAMLSLGFGGFYYYKHYLNTDTAAPVITASQDTIECTIDASNEELCAGLSASDDRDGDLTSQIMINGITVKEDTDTTNNEFNISYIVFDSSNNMATYDRTLVYTDYTSPQFAISAPLRFTSFTAVSESLQDYLTASDCIEGDLSSQITLELSEDYQNAAGSGSYECHASVKNQLGDTSRIPIVLEVYLDEADSAIVRPEIALTNYIVYLHQGDEFKPKSYLSAVTLDSRIYTFLTGKEADYVIVDDSTYLTSDAENSYYTDTYDYQTQAVDTSKYLTPFEDGYTTTTGETVMFKSSVSINSDVDTSTPGSYVVNYSISDPDSKQVGNANLIVVVD